jgi:serine protease Do
MAQQSRDARLLILAGIIGLAFGGLAGIAGGVLVSTGKIGPLSRYLTLPTATINASPSAMNNGPVAGGTVAPRVRVEEESATIDVVRRASPAVVSIVVRKEIVRGNVFPFDDFFEFGIPFPRTIPRPVPEGEPGEKHQVGGGSGFIVTSDGYILTNRHVVADTTAEYSVVLSDDREFKAKVLAKDPLNDLAVLKIDAGNGALPVLELGDSDQIRIGETVIAIGYALSEFRNTVTKGVISGINRRVVAGDQRGSSEVIQEAIQTDAAINPGNSGGPLLNLSGAVIGVNTAVSQQGQLIGFAIPINVAKHAVDSVIREGRIVRPWLGVRYLVITERLAKQQKLPVNHGALVVRGSTPADLAVVPGSPADKGDVKENDIITELDDERIDEDHPLANRIARKKSGDRVRLTVLRQGKQKQIEVTLGEFPE